MNDGQQFGNSIGLITIGYGAPALTALRQQLSMVKGDQPLAPVTVVVPNNFVGVSTRRALATGDYGPVCGAAPGLAGVTFLTVYRLAELLGASALAAAKRRPVSTPVLAAAVRSELAINPGIFGPVSEHPTTERRLVEAHRELSDVDERGLGLLANKSQRAANVVDIHRRVQHRLGQRWYTEQDLVTSAIAQLHEASDDPLTTSLTTQLGTVLVFLPQDLTQLRANLLVGLSAHTKVKVIVGQTGEPDADAAVATALVRLGIEVPPPPAPQSRTIDTISVSDPDDEVRHAIRGILEAAREGVRLDRMAVVYASASPYARLLTDHLGTAGIPYNGEQPGGLNESVSGRLLLRLLALPDRDLRRDDLIGLISSVPFLWKGGLTPSRLWDDVSRKAGIVQGLDDWTQKLTRYAQERDAEIERLGEDPEYEYRVRKLTREMTAATSLLAFVTDLDTELARGLGSTNWRQRTQWAKRTLRHHLGDQADWPQHERSATERLERILDRLAGLDEIEPNSTGAVFRRTLETEMEGGLGRIGRFGDGVLVGRAWSTVGVTLDRLWVLGLSEGTFPSRPREDSLLPDRERSATGGQLALRSDRTGDEHRHLLATLASVADDNNITLLRSRGDLRATSERPASRWLGTLAPLDEAGEIVSHEVPSFAGGLLATAFPATVQEYDLRSLSQHVQADQPAHTHPLVRPGTVLGRSAEMQTMRGQRTFTRFDGNLDGLEIPDPTATGIISTTALETWAKCPHAYLVRQLLGVDPLDTPEQVLRIDPMSRGTLVHEVLEQLVAERVRDDPDHQRPRGWTEADRDRVHELASAEFERAQASGITGQHLYWRRDQVLIRRDLDAFIDRDRTRRHEHSLSPVAAELAFGIRGQSPALISLPSGRQLRLRGSIDLVDQTDDGALHVVDYKTGKPIGHFKNDHHHSGTKLQLALYAQAARQMLDMPDAPVHSMYWFVTTKHDFAERGYDVTDEVVANVNGVVDSIVANIVAGRFPLHPGTSTRQAYVECEYCDPDGLGVRQARRFFERMANQPELADFVALAEPKLLDQPTLGAQP